MKMGFFGPYFVIFLFLASGLSNDSSATLNFSQRKISPIKCENDFRQIGIIIVGEFYNALKSSI